MPKTRSRPPRLFPALLKHWRGRRGLSQLDLAVSADVSARHVSFLETGRAQPSREMVLRLGSTLEVPLRDQNAMLQAAGHPEEFVELSFDEGLPPEISGAIERMLTQHEPFPMMVMDRHYNQVRTNSGAARLLGGMIAEPSAMPERINVFHVLFDPRLARPFIVEWERVARALLSRLHRESLARPEDQELAALVRSIFEYPDVPQEWRQPDFSAPSEPTLTFRIRRDDVELSFLTTVTIFNAPQNVTLEELRIESYFPTDEVTEAFCRNLAG